MIDLHNNANVKMLDVKRKRQQLLCIWRNIHCKHLETCCPIWKTRNVEGTTIRLPILI